MIEINVLQEKNYRLDKKIVKAQEEHVNYDKSTRHILNLIQKLNNDCDNQKQYENSLDNESYTIQNKVLEKLKVMILFLILIISRILLINFFFLLLS